MKLAWITAPEVNNVTEAQTEAAILKIPEAAQFFDGFVVIGPPLDRHEAIAGTWLEAIEEVKRTGKHLIHGRRVFMEWDDFDVDDVYRPEWWTDQLRNIKTEARVLGAYRSVADVEPYGAYKGRWKQRITDDPGRVASAIARCRVRMDYVDPTGSENPESYTWALGGVGLRHCCKKTYKIGDVNQPVKLNPPWATPDPRIDAWMSYINPTALTVAQAIEVWRQVEASGKYPDTKDFIAYSDQWNTAAMLAEFGEIGGDA